MQRSPRLRLISRGADGHTAVCETGRQAIVYICVYLYMLRRTKLSYGQVDHFKYVAHICIFRSTLSSLRSATTQVRS